MINGQGTINNGKAFTVFVNKAIFVSPEWHRNSLFGGIHTTNRVSVSNWLKVPVKNTFTMRIGSKGRGKANAC